MPPLRHLAPHRERGPLEASRSLVRPQARRIAAGLALVSAFVFIAGIATTRGTPTEVAAEEQRSVRAESQGPRTGGGPQQGGELRCNKHGCWSKDDATAVATPTATSMATPSATPLVTPTAALTVTPTAGQSVAPATTTTSTATASTPTASPTAAPTVTPASTPAVTATPVVAPFAAAGTSVVVYGVSSENFPNPNRGFQPSYEDDASGIGKLSLSGFAADSATTPRRYAYLPTGDAPLSAAVLAGLAEDFNHIRASGKLVDLRFAYSNPDNGWASPPFSRIKSHLAQLTPLVSAHADVISTLEMGLIGDWGETHWSHTSIAGYTDPGAHDFGERPQFLDLLTDALDGTPGTLPITIRYPHWLREWIAVGALTSSQLARIGIYNDGFLTSEWSGGVLAPHHNGTFAGAWPRSEADHTNPATDINQNKAFLEAWSETHPSRGESDIDLSSEAAWALRANNLLDDGFARYRIDKCRWWGSSPDFETLVLDPLGKTEEVLRKLGYRLILNSATFPSQVVPGSAFAFTMVVENGGYAPPRRSYAGTVAFGTTVVPVSFSEPTTAWQGGTTRTVMVTGTVPQLPAGSYPLSLGLLDPHPSLQSNSKYSIRLANTVGGASAWDPSTGRNNLGVSLRVGLP